jgi:N-terminal domain of anti-restriction factor ArdC
MASTTIQHHHARTKRDIYQDVTARILAELEAGAAPWVKPWSATPGRNTPCNAVTNRPYSGCNVVLLWMAANAGYRTPRYLTFKQAQELGGNVRKGEHGQTVYLHVLSSSLSQVADRWKLAGGTSELLRQLWPRIEDEISWPPPQILRDRDADSIAGEIFVITADID